MKAILFAMMLAGCSGQVYEISQNFAHDASVDGAQEPCGMISQRACAEEGEIPGDPFAACYPAPPGDIMVVDGICQCAHGFVASPYPDNSCL